jgi:hypothetical protein
MYSNFHNEILDSFKIWKRSSKDELLKKKYMKRLIVSKVGESASAFEIFRNLPRQVIYYQRQYNPVVNKIERIIRNKIQKTFACFRNDN